MIIEVLKSKIHRARVTQAELNYVGSITIGRGPDGCGQYYCQRERYK